MGNIVYNSFLVFPISAHFIEISILVEKHVMGRKISLLIFLAISFSVQGQVWFDVGLKGGVGAGFLMNKELNSDARLSHSPGMNNFYGGKVGVNFGESFGISFEVDYGSHSYGFNQAEVIGLDQNISYKYEMAFKRLNISPLFRYTKEASYLEIGPSFKMLSNQMLSDEAYAISQPAAEDVMAKRLTGLVFGFGGHMVGNETISLMMGLRFSYSLTALNSTDVLATTFPFTNYNDISNPASVNPLDAQLVIELNYSLGYFATASCGRRTAFLTF